MHELRYSPGSGTGLSWQNATDSAEYGPLRRAGVYNTTTTTGEKQ